MSSKRRVAANRNLLMPTLKRPASCMKRPAAGGSINDTIAKMAKGTAVDQDGDPEVEPEDEDNSGDQAGRDKAKGQKYAKLKSTLPDHVVDLIEKQSQSAVSPREFKTSAINRLFVRKADGRLELNLKDAMFEEHKTLYTKKYNKEQDTALPETILCGLYFHNDKQAMEAAKRSGDIEPVDVGGGKTFWAFTSFKKGRENGSVDEQKLHRSQAVNSAQAKALAGIFKSVGWTWKYGESEVQALTEGTGGIPSSILTLIKQAEGAQNKMLKEATSFIKSWKGDKNDERLLRLKKCSAQTGQNLASLQHLRDFHELPGEVALTKPNLDKMMTDQANHVQQFNELIETTRGVLRAQKN